MSEELNNEKPTLADVANEELGDIQEQLRQLELKKLAQLEGWLHNFELPLIERLRLFLNYYPQADPMTMKEFETHCPKNWSKVWETAPEKNKVYRIYEEFEELYEEIVQGDNDDNLSIKDLELMEEWMNARAFEWEAKW